ncbi:hypothetical protein DFP73DRAFT_455220, partial [Morchella snyderi]
LFTLRAYICVVGADMPGREKIMNFKGNRATSYCPYCYIQGVHNRSVYCPLKPPLNPPARHEELEWETYDASNLPMRDDKISRQIATHVVQTGDDNAAKRHGIKGPSCLSQLPSIDIPRSFPPDAMHLWWENVIPDMVEHWRGKFFSDNAYNIAPEVWESIGKDMQASACTFPSSFGDPIRDFTEHCHHLKAAEWKIFTLLLASIYFKDNLSDEDYDEFINIVETLQFCNENELTFAEISVVDTRIRRFISYYE